MGEQFTPLSRLNDCELGYSYGLIENNEGGRQEVVRIDLNTNDETPNPRIIKSDNTSIDVSPEFVDKFEKLEVPAGAQFGYDCRNFPWEKLLRAVKNFGQCGGDNPADHYVALVADSRNVQRMAGVDLNPTDRTKELFLAFDNGEHYGLPDRFVAAFRALPTSDIENKEKRDICDKLYGRSSSSYGSGEPSLPWEPLELHLAGGLRSAFTAPPVPAAPLSPSIEGTSNYAPHIGPYAEIGGFMRTERGHGLAWFRNKEFRFFGTGALEFTLTDNKTTRENIGAGVEVNSFIEGKNIKFYGHINPFIIAFAGGWYVLNGMVYLFKDTLGMATLIPVMVGGGVGFVAGGALSSLALGGELQTGAVHQEDDGWHHYLDASIFQVGIELYHHARLEFGSSIDIYTTNRTANIPFTLRLEGVF